LADLLNPPRVTSTPEQHPPTLRTHDELGRHRLACLYQGFEARRDELGVLHVVTVVSAVPFFPYCTHASSRPRTHLEKPAQPQPIPELFFEHRLQQVDDRSSKRIVQVDVESLDRVDLLLHVTRRRKQDRLALGKLKQDPIAETEVSDR
jgi:hypothetical protein